MNGKLANQLHSNLDRLVKNGTLANKSIILFGANKPAELTISFLSSKSIPVYAIIDNAPAKHGKTQSGVPICKPDDVLRDADNNTIVLIASKYYKQMRNSIAKYNLTETQVIETIYFHEYSLEPKIFRKHADIAIDGWIVYDRLKKTHGDDVFIILNPNPSLGDTYMLLSYLGAYIKSNGIENYVVVISGGGASRVAEMFEETNCLQIPQDDNDALLALHTLMNLPDVLVAACDFHYTRLTAATHGQELLNWGGIMREVVLGLEPNAIKTLPNKPVAMEDKDFFKNNKLSEGKTVLLAPTAVNALSPPDTFWSALVEALNNEGYTVRLNVAEDEAVSIVGAEPIFVPLGDIIPFVETAGVFIALRNGLCDVLCEANAKKIVIYPDEDYFEFFRFDKIGLTDSFIEILFRNDNSAVESILEYL